MNTADTTDGEFGSAFFRCRDFTNEQPDKSSRNYTYTEYTPDYRYGQEKFENTMIGCAMETSISSEYVKWAQWIRNRIAYRLPTDMLPDDLPDERRAGLCRPPSWGWCCHAGRQRYESRL